MRIEERKIYKKIRPIALQALIALLLLAVLLIPANHVEADISGTLTDAYVNATTGSASYDGSSPVHTSGNVGPKKTIKDGISVVADNGTVHVAAGTYYEYNIDLQREMKLVGDGALTTIIDGGSHGYVLEVSTVPYQHNTISGFTIQHGGPSGSDAGGGIYIYQNHILTLNDCAIINNSKGGGSDPRPNTGGGLCNDNGAVYMNRCTVSGNTATSMGGGIANICDGPLGGESGVMVLTNCTISGNTVTGYNGVGGGLYNSWDATTNLLNVTIANNHTTDAVSAGGGFSNYSSMYFKNCIVANNTAGLSGTGNGYEGLAGGTHSQGYNIASDNLSYFDQPTDQRNTDPLLGPLQNNGGPTSTLAITAASPAFNRGTNNGAPLSDQRGVSRPQAGICDVGAFELEMVLPAVTAVAPSQGAQGQTITVVITGANFSGASLVSFGADITVNSYTVDGASQITASITIAPGAVIGPRNISVTTIAGTGTGAGLFTVLPNIIQFTKTQYGGTQSQQVPTVSLPNILIQTASLSASKIPPGSTVEVSATVVNSGNANGAASVRLYINGQLDAEQGINLASGQQLPLKFSVSRDQPGTYQVYVNNKSAGSFTVDAVQDSEIILYISVACVMFGLILGIIYWRKKRAF